MGLRDSGHRWSVGLLGPLLCACLGHEFTDLGLDSSGPDTDGRLPAETGSQLYGSNYPLDRPGVLCATPCFQRVSVLSLVPPLPPSAAPSGGNPASQNLNKTRDQQAPSRWPWSQRVAHLGEGPCHEVL